MGPEPIPQRVLCRSVHAWIGDTMTDHRACPCSGRNLARLIQPAVLTLLVEEDLHGYEILHRLGGLRIYEGSPPDARGVYRALQALEDGGRVTGSWISSDSGPSKRLYHITEEGLQCFHSWINTLRSYRLAIDELLTAAESAFLSAAAGERRSRR